VRALSLCCVKTGTWPTAGVPLNRTSMSMPSFVRRNINFLTSASSEIRVNRPFLLSSKPARSQLAMQS